MSNQMYYSEKELAERMNMSYWAIRRMRLQLGLPYIPIGRKIYYDEKKVREWFDSRTVNIADSKAMNRIY